MKNLLYKEIKLVITPAAYMFACLSALLLIPSYPYCVGLSYCIFSIVTTFGVARANNDHQFTAMLPVSRNDIVKAKHMTVVFIELIQIITAVPFALLSSLVLNKQGNIVGMDANFAFFGMAFIAFSVFNIIFLPGYFKTGYKTGMPVIIGLTCYVLILALFETLTALIPFLKKNLDSLDGHTFIYQIPVLAIGILIYLITIFISYKISVKKFEKVSF